MMNIPYYQPQVQSFSTPTYTIPPVQTAQVPQMPQMPQVPQIDNSRINAQFAADILSETAAFVELNKCAVNLEKEIQQTQDPEKKARLQVHLQDLNKLIAQKEQKINQLQTQSKQFES